MHKIIKPSRRSFLAGLAGIIAAPALVRADSLMPVKMWRPGGPVAYGWIDSSFLGNEWRWQPIPWTIPGPEPVLAGYQGGPLYITDRGLPSGPPKAGIYIDPTTPFHLMDAHIEASDDSSSIGRVVSHK